MDLDEKLYLYKVDVYCIVSKRKITIKGAMMRVHYTFTRAEAIEAIAGFGFKYLVNVRMGREPDADLFEDADVKVALYAGREIAFDEAHKMHMDACKDAGAVWLDAKGVNAQGLEDVAYAYISFETEIL